MVVDDDIAAEEPDAPDTRRETELTQPRQPTPGLAGDKPRLGSSPCSIRSACHPARRLASWCWRRGPGRCCSRCSTPRSGTIPARVVAVGVDRDCRAVRDRRGRRTPHLHACASATIPTAPPGTPRSPTPPQLHQPDLIVSAGFMKILGPEFLSRFIGRVVNTHPALLPSFPGAHAVPGRAGLRREGHRVHRAPGGRRDGHRPDPGSGGGRRCSTATTKRRCTNASRSSSDDCWWTCWPRWRTAV